MKTFSFYFATAILVVATFFATPVASQQPLLTLPFETFPPQAEWELPYGTEGSHNGRSLFPRECEPYVYIAFNAEGQYAEYSAPDGTIYVRYFSSPHEGMECYTEGFGAITLSIWTIFWPADLSGTEARFWEYYDQTRYTQEYGAGECRSYTNVDIAGDGIPAVVLYFLTEGQETGWSEKSFIWPEYEEGERVNMTTWTVQFGSEPCEHLQAMDPRFLFALGLPVEVSNEQNGPQEVPTSTTLGSAYPNPFSSSTTIPFELSQAGDVRIAVYDLLGRKVADLVNDQLSAGRHEVSWTPEGLPSGVYVYWLSTDSEVLSGRVMLTR